MSENILLKSIAIGGYRSFGELQQFERFAKVNLIIGQNNVGKSNIFKFLTNIYPLSSEVGKVKLEVTDRHVPTAKKFQYGLAINADDVRNELIQKVNKHHSLAERIITAMVDIAANKTSNQQIWYYFDEQGNPAGIHPFKEVLKEMPDHEVERLWASMTHFSSGGSRNNDWAPALEKLTLIRPAIHNVEFIPAIREINSKGNNRSKFSGEKLNDELAKLQNPSSHEQVLREKFEQINKFLQQVTTNPSARIEIPYSRDTINVSMNNRVLPLEALGTGIQEIVILAAAATTIDSSIVCVEEPELHLNPILQKRLVRYLERHTNNQYLISTHSASLMDTPNSEIYHIRLVDDESRVERVTSDKKKTEICADLGYHPSDLLQSNCVIWVEGPSDRIYLNYWIKAFDSGLLEGLHYSIMFYGGKLLSHLTADHEVTVSEFISLRRLNRQAVILIDSDRDKKGAKINQTKRRVVSEFEKGPGFAWVTQGREIENYLLVNKLKSSITKVHPSATLLSPFGQYDNNLKIKLRKSEPVQASKVEVAKMYTKDNPIINSDDVQDIYDLKSRVRQLVEFIKISNQNA